MAELRGALFAVPIVGLAVVVRMAANTDGAELTQVYANRDDEIVMTRPLRPSILSQRSGRE